MSRVIDRALTGATILVLLLPSISIAQDICPVELKYNGNQTPESQDLPPEERWMVWEEEPVVDWYCQNNKLLIDAYDPDDEETDGKVSFYRIPAYRDGAYEDEEFLTMASRYEIRATMRVLSIRPDPPYFPPYWTDFVFGANDGCKQVGVWGSLKYGNITIQFPGSTIVPLEGLGEEATYRLVVDRSHGDPMENTVELYREDDLGEVLLVSEL